MSEAKRSAMVGIWPIMFSIENPATDSDFSVS